MRVCRSRMTARTTVGGLLIAACWLCAGAGPAWSAEEKRLPGKRLALGIGAQHPRFKIDNAAKIATGFGGLLYMGQGIALALATTLTSIYPTLLVHRWLQHGELPTLGRAALGILLAALTLGGPILLARRALRRGATSLRKRGV